MTNPPILTLEQRSLTGANTSISFGNYYSSELGAPVKCFTRKGFWLDHIMYRENYRLNPYNSTFKELRNKTNNDILKNAMNNTLFYWQVGAGYTKTTEIRDLQELKTLPSSFGNILTNYGLNVNAETGVKVPIRLVKNKLKKDYRKSDKKILSPVLKNGHSIMIGEQKSYACESKNCSSTHTHLKIVKIPYTIYLNSRYDNQDIYTKSFANVSYIEDRAVIKQAYSVIELDQSSKNEYDGETGYIEGLTHLREVEEVIYDRRTEYNSLIEKLKAARIENPDEFIKDYSAIDGAITPGAENEVLKYIREKNELKDIDIESIASELTNLNYKPKNAFAENNVKNDAHFEIDEMQYYNKFMQDDEYEDENIPYKERYLAHRDEGKPVHETGRRENPFQKEGVPDYIRSTKEENPSGGSSPEYDKLHEGFLDIVKKIDTNRTAIKEKYGIDICNLDLTDEEYYVMSNAQEIYEYSNEELAKIKTERRKTANKIYRAYKEHVNDEVNTKELREFKIREKTDNLKRAVKNTWVDVYNSSLDGILYLDTSLGIDADFISIAKNNTNVFERVGVKPMGYRYAQTGIGYATDYLNLSTGITAQVGKYAISGDEIKKPTFNPYVKLEIFPDFFDCKDEHISDYERLNHYGGWKLFVQYEPVTTTVTAGISLNATPKVMKKN